MDAKNTIINGRATGTTPHETLAKPPPPPLTFDLIESILIHVPLRFPLRLIEKYMAEEYAANMHTTCAAALVVVSLPRAAYQVFLPRMPQCLRKILAHKERFSVEYLPKLLGPSSSGYSRAFGYYDTDAFAAAFALNRADILDWWVEEAKLEVPPFHGAYYWDDNPIVRSVQAEAWDALDWLARSKYAHLCEERLTDQELARLIETGGKRQLQFVALWLKAGFDVPEYLETAIEAACEVGSVEVLQGWVEGHEVWYEREDMDRLCAHAVSGKDPVIPVLEWMLENKWPMPNLAEYASVDGKVDVLEWWKENKEQMDAHVEEAYSEEADELDPSDMEIEPEWLSEIKYGFCLDLARENGHQHVVDWWMQHVELLPIPNSVAKVTEASAEGVMEFLKIWNGRRGVSTRPYDCNEALRQATTNGQLAVLEWWFKESNVQLEFDIADMIGAALASDDHWKDMVDWWMHKSGVTVDLDQCARVVNQCTYVAVLERWDQLDRFLPFDATEAIINAARSNAVYVLDWWAKQHPADFDMLVANGKTQLADVASSKGAAIHALGRIRELCMERGIEFCYSEQALDGIAWHVEFRGQFWFIPVIRWWIDSGLKLKYSDSAFKNAVLWFSEEECQWWLQQSLPVSQDN
ncbi:hypothetical protein BCR44DRAFT_48410 [Catenaria anguillulae PL171]|uniref:Uncharacterized protein n=1 Tax=Catenaria anguillulae PL171 TaxID=765915 RepID=A0A1Y2H798_9FUNG|nr:hypothetical protein BCR44DRAFT_48410 [Catenaria anguillulae PL171]